MVRRGNIVLLLLAMLALLGCSTQKNTRASRSYHAMKVRYNIFYNGNLSYDQGQKAIAQACRDDYSTILPLYPVSDHNAAQGVAGQMDITIEKCRKAIKLHSIKAKPTADPKKKSDPKYKEWLKQEEFNPAMGDAWIRLGEAEFHKGDFLGSIGTFGYVQRHYSLDKDMVARCQLWMARAYGEMGWTYEAEEMLRRVEQDDLKPKNASFYAAVAADVKLKSKAYDEALPFVKIALPSEKRKGNRPRFAFVLAQLYERQGKKQEAINNYTKVLRMTPKEEMDFHARLHRAELKGKSAIRDLEKQAKLDKNKDRLDAIYGSIGNIYLAAGDTTSALKQYAKAIEESTQGGTTKLAILRKAADLCFERKDYAAAQPYYSEALSMMNAEHEDYAMLAKRSEILDELIIHTSVVILQDSLQYLSTLSEEEQMKVAERLVADLIEQEKRDSTATAEAEREAELAAKDGTSSVNTSGMVGGVKSGDFYFYNQQVMASGKQNFRKVWGTRPLEDNWRRISKAMASNTEESDLGETDEEDDKDGTDGELGEGATDSSGMDSTKEKDNTKAEKDSIEAEVITDPHDPRYYLAQIPKTEADLHASDSLIADAYYALIPIYRNKLEDIQSADETMAEYRRRFPNDPRIAEIDRMDSLMNLAKTDTAWVGKEVRKINLANTLYKETYSAYTRAEYNKVKANCAYADTACANSPMMPRFLFLRAVAVARTEGQEAFVESLTDMVTRYPDATLSAMAKDMLAMLGQGYESQKGEKSNEAIGTEDLQTDSLTSEDEIKLVEEFLAENIVILTPEDPEVINQLLYEVALFNFQNFLVRDFDLHVQKRALLVEGFENKEEVAWYIGLIGKNPDLMSKIRLWNVVIEQR